MKGLKGLKLKEKMTLSSLTIDDLKKELERISKITFLKKMKLSMWELKQTHIIKVLRRYIARINTMISIKSI